MSASRPASLSALSAASVEEKKQPRTRAKTAPKKVTAPTTRKKATTSTTKKPVLKSKAKSKKVEVAASNRPTWKDIIRECIADNKDVARFGVSRSTIKKFAEERYGVEMNPMNLFQLGRAITSGTETGIFALPKGPVGKVKLAPKTAKPSAAKENSKPPSKTTTTTTKKPTSAKPASKKATKVLASKAKSPTRKTTSKRNSVKKAVTGSTPAVRAKAVAAKKKPVARK